MRIFIAGSAREEIPSCYIEEAKKVIEFIWEKNFNVLCCADERSIVGEIYRKAKGTRKKHANGAINLSTIYQRN